MLSRHDERQRQLDYIDAQLKREDRDQDDVRALAKRRAALLAEMKREEAR